MTEILISLTRNQKNIVLSFACFGIFPVFIEICSTHFTLQCSKSLLHMKKHKNKASTVTFVEKKFQDEMVHEKTYANKAQYFVWFQVGDAKISDIFHKIQLMA